MTKYRKTKYRILIYTIFFSTFFFPEYFEIDRTFTFNCIKHRNLFRKFNDFNSVFRTRLLICLKLLYSKFDLYFKTNKYF
ncbi:hypothetical protein BpHYR1_022639 [Brachionus plicatilis]|uniref:Uncharacterized protein n=1 Tax=Brachionus plicatilis TaxID=10195 RepID=A0A3M7Q744_BRAPC|nr:hypothetical protein BpHYR1_022639 [Brachionus plicatilis]